MRTLFLAFCVLTFSGVMLPSCNDTNPEVKAEEKPAPVVSPDYEKGLTLAAQSDCFTCHKVDEKNIGPSYREIATKYDSTNETIELLADKIRKGGSGVWGTIPMTPHPQIAEEDAKTIVKYIFCFKK